MGNTPSNNPSELDIVSLLEAIRAIKRNSDLLPAQRDYLHEMDRDTSEGESAVKFNHDFYPIQDDDRERED